MRNALGVEIEGHQRIREPVASPRSVSDSAALLITSAIATAAICPAGIVAMRRFHLLARNYRGVRVVRPTGLVALVVWLLSIGVVLRPVSVSTGRFAAFVVAGWGFALLGAYDDLYGDRSVGGFRGHFAALREGRVTSGVIKAVGGLSVGLAAAWLLGLPAPRILLAAALIALSANFLNLLDLRPGRALKVFFAAGLLAWLFSMGRPGWAMWPALLPPAAAMLVIDLGEWGMLGDAGSNFLGAVLGLTFVVNFGWQVQLAAAILLAAATVASEKHSFSAAIEKVPAARWLDMLGRRST